MLSFLGLALTFARHGRLQRISFTVLFIMPTYSKQDISFSLDQWLVLRITCREKMVF